MDSESQDEQDLVFLQSLAQVHPSTTAVAPTGWVQDVFIARCKDNAELPRRQEVDNTAQQLARPFTRCFQAVFFRDTFLKHCNSSTVRLRSQRLGEWQAGGGRP